LLRLNHGPRQVLSAGHLDRHLKIFLNETGFLAYAEDLEKKTTTTPEAPPEPETPEIKTLRQQIADVKSKIGEQEQELTRFKQRNSGQILNTILSAEEKLMKEVLPMLDDLERGLQHQDQPVESLRQGLALIKNKYQAMVAKFEG
jgi:molecular chaperone GrpE (heat shock protein)